MCTPHPQKEALNNEKCHLCKMQEMSMPACECALCMFLCVHVYIYGCVVVSCISENVCTGLRVCTRICVQIYRPRDRGVCKGVSVYDDGKAGLLSFNIVLVGHWAICKCTELTAEAQSSLVHPPTSSTPTPLASLPLPAYPLWLTALVVPWNRGTNADMAQDGCWEPCLHRGLFADDELWTG